MSEERNDLGRRIYDGSWRGEYWGREGVIVLSKRRFRQRVREGKHAEALSALSSTYYSACGQAIARLKGTNIRSPHDFFDAMRLGVLVLWCAWRTSFLSEIMEMRAGLANLTADQLDIRGRILLLQKRYRKAYEVTDRALDIPNLSPDTHVLLEIGLGEIANAMGRSAQAEVCYDRARAIVDGTRPTTQVRFYRSLAGHCKKNGELGLVRPYALRAMEIAEQNGLTDQLIKIQPYL